ncbi:MULTISPECIES: YedE family putative selenium transporter [unclassified Desulfovibrio]|uniref:YedE family putative selenium transporter n=1 Tax=unclassified Desulfovibrio TaxID=2593640 RepID=UPI000F5F0E3C|nr:MULTISPECIES: YedE family putative selenium transporter [unclassified Desulfovibrio]RRD69867.1 YedE-related selenium metabolism membrane protein [Desulfovibrio sp. OH1209_COT-279]RRD86458.1 YedE-related selenium metabolism membrane protein [Desulfovibrio sp. OH1186_COT-070]
MKTGFNFFSTATGIAATGLIFGVLAILLQKAGNPGNMGVCVACFSRDLAGAVGLHRAAVVQYLRPEIMGMVLGAFGAALAFGEYRPRGGSAPATRFLLGAIAGIGALVFLGCPWRALLRLAGGDAHAIFGLLGLIAGVGVGTIFFRMGFSLGRSQTQGKISGLVLPALMLGLVALALANPPIPDQAQSGVLFYSLKGPGAQHAPFFLSLGAGLAVGFFAQRSRFCTMGAVRDVLLFNQWHLALGFLAMLAAALFMNLAFGTFHWGFENQPVAQPDNVWNFLGMVTSGLAFALAGGCPGRQLFMAGEGDNDAAVFALGLVTGAAMAHNFGMASSPVGIGPHGIAATLGGLGICLMIGFFNCKRGA